VRTPKNFYSDEFDEKNFVEHFGLLGQLMLERFNGDMESAAQVLTEYHVGDFDNLEEFYCEYLSIDFTANVHGVRRYLDHDKLYQDCFESGDFICLSAEGKLQIFEGDLLQNDNNSK